MVWQLCYDHRWSLTSWYFGKTQADAKILDLRENLYIFSFLIFFISPLLFEVVQMTGIGARVFVKAFCDMIQVYRKFNQWLQLILWGIEWKENSSIWEHHMKKEQHFPMEYTNLLSEFSCLNGTKTSICITWAVLSLACHQYFSKEGGNFISKNSAAILNEELYQTRNLQ